MADAAAYLKLGRKIQSDRFGRAGVARKEELVRTGEVDAAASGSYSTVDVNVSSDLPTSGLVVIKVHDAQRDVRQLPMKKKKGAKRARSGSDDEDQLKSLAKNSSTTVAAAAVEHPHEVSLDHQTARGVDFDGDLNLTNVASPTAPVPPVEGMAQRINLMSKWFPASLQERSLDAAVAPSMTFVETTVDRVNKMREYVLILRYGIEDVEALLEETRQAQPGVWETGAEEDSPAGQRKQRSYWELSGKDVRALVRSVGLAPFTQALAEFSDVAFGSFFLAAAAVHRLLARRRRLGVPMGYHIKAWHEYLHRYGPEIGRVPRLSDILWLSAASVSAMFTAAATRLLRGARSCAENTVVPCATEDESASCAESQGDHESSDRPRFFDNTEPAVDEGAPLTAHVSLLDAPASFASTLTPDQRALLSFLRFLMPTSPLSCERRATAGYGVWLFAAFSALDIPLDPDTDRLAHDLFRTCCRHLRTLASWQGVSGSTRDLLLNKLNPRASDAAPPSYASLDDVRREDVLALYTIVVVLARFFRQNQDHFMPL
ncbi:hypothetical protein JKF63_00119 [Porcisia hertigi]|uniref:Gem-associated protein 2 n=1 Tax=Porcisia hertigi TaxID=2761500 RepID=A0A836I7Q6_9TRYP|nr:hypothetical protein JKF63_00119 [Porcisia hertigi]